MPVPRYGGKYSKKLLGQMGSRQEKIDVGGSFSTSQRCHDAAMTALTERAPTQRLGEGGRVCLQMRTHSLSNWTRRRLASSPKQRDTHETDRQNMQKNDVRTHRLEHHGSSLVPMGVIRRSDLTVVDRHPGELAMAMR